MKLLLLLITLSLTGCAGWNPPRLSLGLTGQSGIQYGVSYDGSSVKLDANLEGLRK